MTNNEIEELNFPVAVIKLLIATNAMLRTVLQNQMAILSKLEIAGEDTVSDQINVALNEQFSTVNDLLKNLDTESQYGIFQIKHRKN